MPPEGSDGVVLRNCRQHGAAFCSGVSQALLTSNRLHVTFEMILTELERPTNVKLEDLLRAYTKFNSLAEAKDE